LRIIIIETGYILKRRQQLVWQFVGYRSPFWDYIFGGGGGSVSVTKLSPKVLGSKSSLVVQRKPWWHQSW